MVLKIDTTTPNQVIVELFLKVKKIDSIVETQKMGSQSLLPSIVKILKKNHKSLTELTEIKVNAGPGSFTGTRIGVAVANALGFALDIPVNSKRGKLAQAKYTKSKFD